MPNTQEADKRLVAWLKERTDRQLERIMEAPEDGLTNAHYRVTGPDGYGCLAGWACYDGQGVSYAAYNDLTPNERGEASSVVCEMGGEYGQDDDGTVFRRIKAYVAAELLTRRVNRKRLPAPQASADPVNEVYALEAEV